MHIIVAARNLLVHNIAQYYAFGDARLAFTRPKGVAARCMCGYVLSAKEHAVRIATRIRAQNQRPKDTPILSATPTSWHSGGTSLAEKERAVGKARRRGYNHQRARQAYRRNELGFARDIGERVVGDFAADHGDGHAELALACELAGKAAELGGQHAVVRGIFCGSRTRRAR